MNDAVPTTPGAYAWWYLDAVSDDGRDAAVVIFFCGAVFSPYYAARLRGGERALPAEHAAVHATLYRDGKRVAWLLAERDSAIAVRDAGREVTIARSRWRYDARGGCEVTVDDRGPFRVAGRVALEPVEPALTAAPVVLAPGLADHRWHARAPRARVRVAFDAPRAAFEGFGYHDVNAGSEPMERALAGWTWARLHEERDRTRVVYDVRARSGARFHHELATGEAPALGRGASPAAEAWATTRWGVRVPSRIATRDPARFAAIEPGEVLESAPFYARFRARGAGSPAWNGVGETLDLARFDSAVVRWMLRWKTFRPEVLGAWVGA